MAIFICYFGKVKQISIDCDARIARAFIHQQVASKALPVVFAVIPAKAGIQ